MPFYYRKTPNKNIFFTYIFYLLTDFQIFCSTFYDKFGTKYCLETILPVSDQEAMAPSRHDWKIVDWDVKPQHNQPTKACLWRNYTSSPKIHS